MRRTMVVIAVLGGIAAFSCMVAGSAPDSGGAGGGTPQASCTTGGAPCDGCCSGSDCLAYHEQTYSLCGVNGDSCVACAANTICDPFIGCPVDPASSWNVWAFAADVTPLNGTVPWDEDGGLPDVFIDLYCPTDAASYSSRTATAPDNLKPTWGQSYAPCVMTARDMEVNGFSVAVYDDDGNPPNDIIAPQSNVKPSDTDFHRGWFTASGSKLNNVWLKLDPQ